MKSMQLCCIVTIQTCNRSHIAFHPQTHTHTGFSLYGDPNSAVLPGQASYIRAMTNGWPRGERAAPWRMWITAGHLWPTHWPAHCSATPMTWITPHSQQSADKTEWLWIMDTHAVHACLSLLYSCRYTNTYTCVQSFDFMWLNLWLPSWSQNVLS